MTAAYLAIGYKCNQRCSFCPCSLEETQFPFIPLAELKNTAIFFQKEKEIDTLVVSGGEPTIHPAFTDFILFLANELKLNVVILSNGEKYADSDFCRRLFSELDVSKVTAITTIHSQTPEEHEAINGSKGSHARSLAGLKNLCALGVDVIVKHCITKRNYKELEEFYNYIDQTLPVKAAIQLCSIDYCGMEQEGLSEHMLSFIELRPFLEKMFDSYLEKRNQGSKRYLYAINMPYCSCDPYYWDILTPKSQCYSGYASPNKDGAAVSPNNVQNNVGTFAEACQDCAVAALCPGTYFTAFELFGNTIVAPYCEES